MKKVFNKEFIIGVSVIVAIVILFFGIEYLKGINLFKPANFYVVNYTNVAGLEVSAPVKIDGFKIGQVREINFNYEKPGNIEVVLAVDKHLHLPVDSRAMIVNGLLDGASVTIEYGKSNEIAPVGSTIEGGVQAGMMEGVTDNLIPAVEAIIPQVDSLLTSINKVVSDPALLKAVQSLDGISKNLYTATSSLNGMMARDLPVVMKGAGRVTNNLDTITSDLAVLSAQLKNLPIASTLDNVESLTANLSKFSATLNDKNSTLGLLTSDPELYNRLNQVSADIDSLIIDIKKNPKRYISIKLL